jgi:hypothetical protein
MDQFYLAVHVCTRKTEESLMSINDPSNRNDIIAALFFLAHMKFYFGDFFDAIWFGICRDLKVSHGDPDEKLNGFFITIVNKRVRIRLGHGSSGGLMNSLEVSVSNVENKRVRSIMSLPNCFESFGEAFNYIATARGKSDYDSFESCYREAILFEEKLNFKIALMMGNHDRLGESSPLNNLAPEIIVRLMTLSGYPSAETYGLGELASCFCFFKSKE